MNQGFHILIIDEDQDLCRALSGVIGRAGYRVECLGAADASLRALSQAPPDLIILGISATDGRGLELLSRIKHHRGLRRLPVIVVSSQSELEYELLDIFDFLSRPVNEKRLLEDLALLADTHRQRKLSPYPPMGKEELALFQGFLISHSGLHFDQRNLKILERGLMRRMRAVNAHDYRDYYHYLEKFHESRQELKKLLGLLTIGETYFFRYLAHFEALTRFVLPELIERNRERRQLRLWSAGCSTGEEPYSLAMVMLEHFPELADWDLEILGTDINKRALRKSREGLYTKRSLRLIDPSYAEKYFRPLGSAFLLDERVRRMVRFAYLNLQTGTFPSPQTGTEGVDILFCRNVMIYFRPATNRRIVEKFSRCLRPGGYLFLGHAETMINISDRYHRIHEAGGFYYRLKQGGESQAAEWTPPALPAPSPPARRTPQRPSPHPTTAAKPAPKTATDAPPEQPSPDLDRMFREAVQAFDRENFRTASQSCDIILGHAPEHVGAMVIKGYIHANLGQHQEALEMCDRALTLDDLCPEVYFLRGLISEMEGDVPGARDEYRKALLLDMEFVMPHYNLSKIYWRLGRQEQARRELNNTVRLLEKTPDESIIPYSGGLSRAVFLEVCREDRSQMTTG